MGRSTRSKKGKNEKEDDERIVEIKEGEKPTNPSEKTDNLDKSDESEKSQGSPLASPNTKSSEEIESSQKEGTPRKFVKERVITSTDKNNNASISTEI